MQFHYTIPVTIFTSAEHMWSFTENWKKFELNSLRMTNRKLSLPFFWYFELYTLNANRSEEYFRYFCYVWRRCQDRKSSIEMYEDY